MVDMALLVKPFLKQWLASSSFGKNACSNGTQIIFCFTDLRCKHLSIQDVSSATREVCFVSQDIKGKSNLQTGVVPIISFQKISLNLYLSKGVVQLLVLPTIKVWRSILPVTVECQWKKEVNISAHCAMILIIFKTRVSVSVHHHNIKDMVCKNAKLRNLVRTGGLTKVSKMS